MLTDKKRRAIIKTYRAVEAVKKRNKKMKKSY